MGTIHLHQEVDTTELFRTLVGNHFHVVWFSHVNVAICKHFRTWSSSGNIGCHACRLLLIATNNASVGTKLNEGSDLGTTDVPYQSKLAQNLSPKSHIANVLTGASGTENDFVVFINVSISIVCAHRIVYRTGLVAIWS